MEDRLSIKNKLNSIFKRRLNIDFIKDESISDENLFSEKVDIFPNDLVYIFFDIEREFCISIDEKDIIEEGFTTFNNIIEVINRKQSA